MKNKLIIIGMIVFLILANSITLFASTENAVTLQTENTEVKVGETFTVNIKVASADGINGIVTKYSYDTEKLELVEKKILDDSNFSTLSGKTSDEIVIISDPEDMTQFAPVTESDIYAFTFKVKDGVEAGAEAKIILSEVHLSTLALENSEHILDNQEITITVLSNENPGTDDPGTDNPGTDDPGTDNPGTDDPGTDDPGTDDPGTDDPGTDDPGTDNPGTDDPGTDDPDKDDNTTADKDYDYAGLEGVIFIIAFTIAIIAMVIYGKINKYRDIN